MTAPKMLRIQTVAGETIGATNPACAALRRDCGRARIDDHAFIWRLEESIPTVIDALNGALLGEDRVVTWRPDHEQQHHLQTADFSDGRRDE